jgi:hypothetical protein
VAAGLAAFAERTAADEIIVTNQLFDHAHRVRSLEIAASAITTDRSSQP